MGHGALVLGEVKATADTSFDLDCDRLKLLLFCPTHPQKTRMNGARGFGFRFAKSNCGSFASLWMTVKFH